MASDGLRVNYSRSHPGQGTTNVCACLDDVFLELLWFDGTPIADETRRIGLAARAAEGSRFGIAWRGEPAVQTRPYAAPFLAGRRSIPVWKGSEALDLPFIFGTPGGVPPIERTDGLPGERQRPELSTLGACILRHPNADPLRPIVDLIDGLEVERGTASLTMSLRRPDGTPGRTIVWS